MQLLHLLWLFTYFSFSAGVGWRGWGGGVLRQVQGLVSNMPFFFIHSIFFRFNSRFASFSEVLTHTPQSIVLKDWKALYIEPESLHILSFSVLLLSVVVLFSMFCHSSHLFSHKPFMCLPRLWPGSNWMTKRILQMRSKLHFKYTNLTRQLANKCRLTPLTDIRNKPEISTWSGLEVKFGNFYFLKMSFFLSESSYWIFYRWSNFLSFTLNPDRSEVALQYPKKKKIDVYSPKSCKHAALLHIIDQFIVNMSDLILQRYSPHFLYWWPILLNIQLPPPVCFLHF